MSGEGFGMSFGVGTGDQAEGDERPEAPQASFSGALPAGGALPLRAIACANFRGAPASRDAAARRVRLSTYDDDFAALGVSLFLHAPDVIGGSEKTLELSLQPKRLADLRPDAILAGCPELAPLGQLREELAQLGRGELERERFEAGLEGYRAHGGLSEVLGEVERALRGGSQPAAASSAPSKPSASSGDSVVDSILDMVAMPGQEDAPTPSQEKAKAALEGFTKGSGKAKLNLSAAEAALAQVIEAQLAPVLTHPQLREVESAWRGLKLVLEAAGRADGIIIEALDLDPAEPTESFQEQVVKPACLAGEGPPPSVVLLDRAFGRSAHDLGTLETLAAGAENMQAPLLVSLSDAFLGLERAGELAGRDMISDLFERGLEKWHSLRGQEPTRWLTAAYNRILLRLPYERGQKGSRAAGETVQGPDDLLWGNAAWGLLAGVVSSSARCGWPSEFRGRKAGLSGLPLRGEAPADQRGPVAVLLSDQHVEDFAGQGIAALTSPKRSDQVIALKAPVAHKAPKGEPKIFTSLTYQLVAGRIAESLLRGKGKVGGATPEEQAERWQDFALAVIGDTGQGAGAGARVEDGVLQLRIRTGIDVLGGVELRMGFPLG